MIPASEYYLNGSRMHAHQLSSSKPRLGSDRSDLRARCASYSTSGKMDLTQITSHIFKLHLHGKLCIFLIILEGATKMLNTCMNTSFKSARILKLMLKFLPQTGQSC